MREVAAGIRAAIIIIVLWVVSRGWIRGVGIVRHYYFIICSMILQIVSCYLALHEDLRLLLAISRIWAHA